jgi:plasmid stabilization system protein ParE
VIVRPEADRDVIESRAWYDGKQPGLGAVFARRVAAAVDRIGLFPELYGEVGRGVRAAPVPRHKHILYYRVRADYVEVLAVLHGGRDPSAWQRRL